LTVDTDHFLTGLGRFGVCVGNFGHFSGLPSNESEHPKNGIAATPDLFYLRCDKRLSESQNAETVTRSIAMQLDVSASVLRFAFFHVFPRNLAAHNGMVAGSSSAERTSLRSLRELRLGKPASNLS
jgi:hypothetical protein